MKEFLELCLSIFVGGGITIWIIGLLPMVAVVSYFIAKHADIDTEDRLKYVALLSVFWPISVFWFLGEYLGSKKRRIEQTIKDIIE